MSWFSKDKAPEAAAASAPHAAQRNRIAVLFQWTYSYLSYKRSARIIVTNPPP